MVIAAEGYPADPVKGDEITGAERAGQDHAYLLHAGTARNAKGALVSAGGRVLNAVGSGPDVAAARARAYELAGTVSLRGGWYRRESPWPRRAARRPGDRGRLLAECAAARIVMEMEIGVVGGEEDGIVGEINEKLYTTPEDALATAEALGLGERGRYLLAATFGNVHGVYKPGNVKLRPPVLKEIQDAVGQKYGQEKPFNLVFHGGSGSALEEIREAISYGVVKMNVDTDTQYAFTRPVADHMFKNYDGVLKIDGEVGSKKVYDPRSWGKAGEAGMAARVTHACEDLLSAGHQLS